ncbi:MAG: hypothetical protein BGO07_01035 [Alphaproteobacteria bacterium 40-19]|nr:MAG: hypothetical protein BGO07_01035 [Alphaproteobacteria bacterium 40-19]
MFKFLKDLFFHIVFYIFGILGVEILIFLMLLLKILPQKYNFKVAAFFPCLTFWMARVFLGIRFRLEGLEHLPKTGPYVIACKHQSAWDTLAFHSFLEKPVFILKASLTRIPIFGKFLKKLGMIPVERGNKLDRKFLTLLKKAIAQQRPIIIFPEGTRVAMGQKGTIKMGTFMLYEKFQLPIIPASLNSGALWARRGFFKKPGLITLRFHPALPPDLHPEEFIELLSKDMEDLNTVTPTLIP